MNSKITSKASRNADIVLQLIRDSGILRPRDLEPHRISRLYLQTLLKLGRIERAGYGLYVIPDGKITEHHTIAEACKRVEHAIICLVSALRFHGLSTQAPFQVWMAIDRKAWLPRVKGIKLRIFRFSGEALTSGIEKHDVEGVTVKVYCPAKTVVDCFKYRNKIGMDVALEAIRDYWRHKKGTMDDLVKYAKICRVENVMRPYMESLV